MIWRRLPTNEHLLSGGGAISASAFCGRGIWKEEGKKGKKCERKISKIAKE
jgi:hypothetical protein